MGQNWSEKIKEWILETRSYSCYLIDVCALKKKLDSDFFYHVELFFLVKIIAECETDTSNLCYWTSGHMC